MNYTILIDDEFPRDLYQKIAQAQKRIYVQFMTFEGDSAGWQLAQKLIAAKKRGIDVKVVIDYYTNFFVSTRYYRFKSVRAEAQQTQEMIKMMRDAGIEVYRTRPYGPFNIFFASRNHKKLVIIDDYGYLGGFNISDHNYAWHDMMIRFEEPAILKTLLKDYEATLAGKRVNINENYIISNEVITERFNKLIRGAKKEIIISSPYFISKDIIDLAKQKKITIKFLTVKKNNYQIANLMSKIIYPLFVKYNIEIYFYEKFSHAKFIIVDREKVLLGSSNFCINNLPYEQEIGVYIEDKKFAEEIYNKLVVNKMHKLQRYQRKFSCFRSSVSALILFLIVRLSYPIFFFYALITRLYIREIKK